MLFKLRRLARSRTGRALGALLMAYAVLLPVYGPFIDPSFAERLPFHKHAYPDGVMVPHVHSYELDAGADGARDVVALVHR